MLGVGPIVRNPNSYKLIYLEFDFESDSFLVIKGNLDKYDDHWCFLTIRYYNVAISKKIQIVILI